MNRAGAPAWLWEAITILLGRCEHPFRAANGGVFHFSCIVLDILTHQRGCVAFSYISVDVQALQLPVGGPISSSPDAGGGVCFSIFLIAATGLARFPACSQGFYAVPDVDMDWALGQGSPFSYFANGFSCTEVEIDALTGGHLAPVVHSLPPTDHFTTL